MQGDEEVVRQGHYRCYSSVGGTMIGAQSTNVDGRGSNPGNKEAWRRLQIFVDRTFGSCELLTGNLT